MMTSSLKRTTDVQDEVSPRDGVEQVMPCGCVVGRYRTYSGHTLELIDAKGEHCADPVHRPNAFVAFYERRQFRR